jgi:hypothetical protein
MKNQLRVVTTLLLSLFFFYCSKPEVPPTPPSITSVSGGSRSEDTAIAGKPFSGVVKMWYMMGNGAAYPQGLPISSTNITGLTAILDAGTLANGQNAQVTFKVTGTPSSGNGTAVFKTFFLGYACELDVTVKTQESYDCIHATGPAQVVCLAKELLAALDATQLATVQLPYTKANAVKWSPEVLPCNSCHIGLQVTGPDNKQYPVNEFTYIAFYKLLRAALNAATDNGNGYIEATNIIETDMSFLNGRYLPIAANGHIFGNYYLAFLGTPSITGTWQLQISGHNLAINNTYVNGQLVSSSPSFRGAEPVSWSTANPPGPNVYRQGLNDEQSGLAAVLASLTPNNLAAAKLATSFSDILLGVDKDNLFPSVKQGLPVSSLSAAQQQLLIAAIRPFVIDADQTAGDAILSGYINEFNNTYISYSGNPTLNGLGDYMRIDGPGVWIEFVCKAGTVTPMACYFGLWRDHKKDYNGL